MFTGQIRDQSGYSLAEVMAAMVILAIAIIPMVSMFDVGLRAATQSSNYDKAWAFAGQRLERAKVLPYAEVRDNFPVPSSTPKPATPGDPSGTGSFTSASLAVPASAGLPGGSTYTVAKQYVRVQQGPASVNLEDSSTDSRMIRVTVTVNWPSNNSISVSGVVAGRLS